MTPRYCAAKGHGHWTDGPCQPGKRTITRIDLRRRIADIDSALGDDETCQSNGYYRNLELRAEREALAIVAARMHG